MGPDNLYCGKWRKISKLCHDLDLGPAMPNIELVRDIFIYYDVLKFHVHRLILLELSCKNTETRKHTHTDSDEYSIVARVLQKRSYNNSYSVSSLEGNLHVGLQMLAP